LAGFFAGAGAGDDEGGGEEGVGDADEVVPAEA